MNVRDRINEINRIKQGDLMAKEGYIYISSLGDINEENNLYELIYFSLDLFYIDIYGEYYEFFVNRAYEFIEKYFEIKGKDFIYSNDNDIELIIDLAEGLYLGYMESEACGLIVKTVENMKTDRVGLLLRAVSVALFNWHCFSKDKINMFLEKGNILIRLIPEDKINSVAEISNAINICRYLMENEFSVVSNEFYVMKAYRLVKKLINDYNNVDILNIINIALLLHNEGKKDECKEITEYIKCNLYKEEYEFLRKTAIAMLLKIPAYLRDDEIRKYNEYIVSKRVEIFNDGTVDLVDK